MQRYDAIIIGTGQAGPSLAERLAKAGMRVAVIERGRFGGTCVNTGCTPTKTLIASARVARLSQRGADYGLRTEGGVRMDMARVKARKDAVVDHATKSVESWMRSLPNTTVYVGQARFVDASTIAVGAQTLSAEKVFIDVGGRPSVPKLPGLERVTYLTSDGMMDIDFLPEHLLIVGGSYVGLEFGQMYRRFGSQVTIVEMGPRLIGREDPDVSDAIADILAAEDIELRLDAKCIALEPTSNGASLRLDCVAGARQVQGTPRAPRCRPRPPILMIWVCAKPESRPTPEAISRSMRRCKPTSEMCTRWGTATGAVPLRIPPITTSRSWPTTF